VEIYPTNHSPFFTTQVTDTLALVDSLYQTVLTAQDADGDTLVFSMLQNPGFLSLQQVDSVSVLVLGTPAATDTGFHLIRVMVSDSRGGTDSIEWTLHILPPPLVNHPPYFTAAPHDTVTVFVDSLYQAVVEGSDTDGDTLVFSLLQQPGFLSLQRVDSVSARVFGTSTTADTGYHLIRVTVSDGRGGADTTEWTLNVITSPTSVQQLSSLPTEFALHQNYPNPFNPTTVIRYQLPVRQDGILSNYVTLKIFNLLGQEVATLVNEVKQAGRYEVSWVASGFASGVYLYRLQAGNYIDTKKLILLK
jgi:hypothetical protein